MPSAINKRKLAQRERRLAKKIVAAADRKANQEIAESAMRKNAAIEFAVLSNSVTKLGQEMRELGDTKRKLTREFAENLGSDRSEKNMWIKRKKD